MSALLLPRGLRVAQNPGVLPFTLYTNINTLMPKVMFSTHPFVLAGHLILLQEILKS